MNEEITRRHDAVQKFINAWDGRGSERSDAQSFWLTLIRALGVDNPDDFIRFEYPIEVEGQTCFIDGLILTTKVLIENKSRGIDLDKPAKQSDGKFLTPFEQAKRYADELPYSRRPRWIVTCNFVELRVYDMDRRDDLTPIVIEVERLSQEFARLNFLIDPNDENVYPEIKISKQAGEIVGALYKAFGNFDPVALNKLCVRLVFCLYAEDSFIFERDQFTSYVKNSPDRRAALLELFNVLNTPVDRRDKNLRAELSQFPYVNGDLFADDSAVPVIDNVISHYLLIDAGDDSQFNWRGISPTIFGALFESTLNPLTRRSGGMHYTAPDNIHKLIDPLFLDDLHDEFQAIRRKKKNRRRELEAFQLKIAALKFFDPACGSGNFLTETYLSLRRLENDVIRELHALGVECRIEISIGNFYGVEINDFAVAVARTALWIAENQMMQETEMIIHRRINFLPLKSAANIQVGNALRLDWQEILPRGVDYIIGNPPFVGMQYRSAAQTADVLAVCKDLKPLDYVACWFKRAADFMRNNQTRAAFVSTNSITQGEQVAPLWSAVDARIDFAHKTFQWTSESEDMAAVHCVIIGFSVAPNDKPRLLFDGKQKTVAKNINGYLIDGPNIHVKRRATPLCDVPKMTKGSQPTDGGHLILTVEERDELLRREPRAEKFIRRFIGAEEFINGKDRYCLWLADATEEELNMPLIAMRLDEVRRFRLSSKKAATRKWAARPHLFTEIRQPSTNYLLVSRISSERRRYVPMGFMTPDVIARDGAQVLPDADLFHFGVMESSVHMGWMRVVCGRLEMRYNYSGTLVYNNFVWCARSSAIEESARRILEARALYPTRTLASLYNEETMPEELRAAHLENDRAVQSAYGFEGLTEAEIVARLMSMYEKTIRN